METCSVCGERSGSVVVEMETSVLEVSDSSCGETMIWDYSLVSDLCLAQHLPAGASCGNIRGVDRVQAIDPLYDMYSLRHVWHFITLTRSSY